MKRKLFSSTVQFNRTANYEAATLAKGLMVGYGEACGGNCSVQLLRSSDPCQRPKWYGMVKVWRITGGRSVQVRLRIGTMSLDQILQAGINKACVVLFLGTEVGLLLRTAHQASDVQPLSI